MTSETDYLKRKLEREKQARKEAERILEQKSLDLSKANEKLRLINQNLEQEVQNRSEKLFESKSNYRQLVENVADIIYKSTAEGRFTFVNGVATEKTGYSEDELLSMNYIDLIRLDYKKKTQEFYYNQLLQKKDKSYFEFPIVTKSEQTIWIGQNVQFEFVNDELIEVFAIARDISGYKYAHEQLTLSEEKYRSIIENLELGLLETDPHGKVLKVYPKFTSLTGYNEDELLGKDAKLILLRNDDEINALTEQEEQRIRKIAGAYETPLYKKDGEKIWVLISAAPILNRDGEIMGTIGLHFDISERKKMEEEIRNAHSEADKARQAEQLFLANMSHEIRTPLNSVIGMAHLLYDLSSTQEQIDYLNALKHSADLLKGIINDILDISSIEAGKLEYNETDFILVDTISSITRTLQLKTQEKDVSVISNIDESLKGLRVLGDNLLLNQVLMNLLGNAEKFTEKGAITVSVKPLNLSKNETKIEFKVSDTGIGINKKRLNSVFEKYEQANIETKMRYGGTGLGLAITKKIIVFLGGEISVESELGKGSHFTVILDFKVAKIKTTEVDKTIDDAISNNYKNLLVAEDNAMNRKYISEVFKKTDITIAFAINGKEAIEKCLTQKYDLILMDLQMPVKDGFEATIDIRTLKNPNNNTQIIGLSAYATEEVRKKCKLAGMDDFVSKPVTPKRLRKLVNITDEVHVKPKTEALEDILDRNLLQELYFGDVEYAFEMFDHFLGVIEEQVQDFKIAINNEDLKEGRRLIHKINPSFAMVGLPALQEMGRKIEEACEQADKNKVDQLSNEFFSLLDSSLQAVKTEHSILKKKKEQNG